MDRSLYTQVSTDFYLKELENKKFKKGELKKYLEGIKKGDLKAKEELILGKIPFVMKIAKKYVGIGLELPDLVNEGIIGMLKALENENLIKLKNFDNNIKYYIEKEIIYALINQESNYISRNSIKKISKFNTIRNNLKLELNREPSIKELSLKMDMSINEIKKIYYEYNKIISLEMILEEEYFNINRTLNISIEEYQLFEEEIRSLLLVLTEKQRKVIEYRYGFDNGEFKSLTEVGRILGISYQSIEQLENRAFIKMRNPLRLEGLEYYIKE